MLTRFNGWDLKLEVQCIANYTHTDTPFIIHFPQMPQFLFINKAIAIIYEFFQLYTTYSALLCMSLWYTVLCWVLDVHVYVLWIVFRNLSEDDVEMCSLWSDIPESLLLQIFSYLDARSLVSIAQTCKVKLFHDIMLKLCKEW